MLVKKKRENQRCCCLLLRLYLLFPVRLLCVSVCVEETTGTQQSVSLNPSFFFKISHFSFLPLFRNFLAFASDNTWIGPTTRSTAPRTSSLLSPQFSSSSVSFAWCSHAHQAHQRKKAPRVYQNTKAYLCNLRW